MTGDGVLLQNRLRHDFWEPKVMECCSKTDFGMIYGRAQYAQSDGVLLQSELSGNSQDSQHGQDDRDEMRLFGVDHAQSDGVLLQSELSGNSQDSQHGQDDRDEMRLFGADRSHTSLRRGSGLREFTSKLLQTIAAYVFDTSRFRSCFRA